MQACERFPPGDVHHGPIVEKRAQDRCVRKKDIFIPKSSQFSPTKEVAFVKNVNISIEIGSNQILTQQMKSVILHCVI